MTSSDDGLPHALRALWQQDSAPRRSRGLTREAIVAAAIELADADGLGALSMARLAERLGCGTMSLYRHVASKDELVMFMLSAGPGPPPQTTGHTDWRGALKNWAFGLWDVYHRHPWILPAASMGPPVDPGQLAWLDAGLAALAPTALSERDKLAAVMAVLHYVRGAAAIDVEAGQIDPGLFPLVVSTLLDRERFPALSAAVAAGVFDGDDDRATDFQSGLNQLLDGIASRLT